METYVSPIRLYRQLPGDGAAQDLKKLMFRS